KKAESSQGGIIQGLKFAFQHKQLKWLYISSIFANIGVLGSVNYQVIMNYGYGDHALKAGLFSNITQAVEAVSINEVTAAIMLFPIGSALAQVIMGFICDSAGRKKAAIVTSLNCLIGFLGFYIGSYCGFNPYVVGFLCGVFVGSYYSTNDIIIMMVGESAPTNLRSSVMSAQFIVTAIGYGLGYGLGLPLNSIFGNTAVGLVSLCMLVPGFLVTLIVLFKKTNETKGLDLGKVTGAEWD
ncbi:MAG: MFS transporter, partial [Acutalibacteraceae bacterium]